MHTEARSLLIIQMQQCKRQSGILQSDRQSWLQSSLDITVDIYYLFIYYLFQFGTGGWLYPYKSEAGLWATYTANPAGTCSALLLDASHVDMR